MGSSTGNMLVDHENALNAIFSESPVPVITHCEAESIISFNFEQYKDRYGDDIPIEFHPDIRSREACFKSSSFAVELAKKHGTRLHIFHISTAEETELFTKEPLSKKMITAEACVHHLWFSAEDYAEKGTLIKWNPAVKETTDRDAILKAVLDGRIDVIATDHAPHTLEEKMQPYTSAPSGGPLVQHALPAMMEFVRDEQMSIQTLVTKMCHNPAKLFKIENRGYIKPGYFADIVLVDMNKPWSVTEDNIFYKIEKSVLEEINQNESNEIIKLKNFAIQKALKRLVFKKFQEYRSAGTGEHFSSKIGVQVLLKDEENLKELLNLTKEEITYISESTNFNGVSVLKASETATITNGLQFDDTVEDKATATINFTSNF